MIPASLRFPIYTVSPVSKTHDTWGEKNSGHGESRRRVTSIILAIESQSRSDFANRLLGSGRIPMHSNLNGAKKSKRSRIFSKCFALLVSSTLGSHWAPAQQEVPKMP